MAGNILLSVPIYVTLLFAFTGVGRIFVRTSFFTSFWYGWAIVLITLNFVHLFVPINQFTLGIFILFGLGSLFVSNRFTALTTSRRSLILSSLVTIICAFVALKPQPVFDDGLYHFQVIEWYSSYAGVPGLANLHGRFGFNSSYYLYCALIDSLPGGAINYAMPLLFIAFAGYIGEQVGLCQRLALWMVIPAFYIGYGVSLSNDFPVVIGVGILLCEAWNYRERRHIGLANLAILSSALLAIKISSLVFGMLIFGLCWWGASAHKIRALAIYAVSLLLLAIHGVLLSGYPLYPVPLLALPLDWTVPVELARNEMQWVISWARWPGASFDQTLSSNEWFTPWLMSFTSSNIVKLAFYVSIASPFFAVMAGMRSRQWLLLLPIVIGIGYWFLSAPDLRFGIAVLWAGASVCIVLSTARRPIINRILYMAVAIPTASLYLLYSLIGTVDRHNTVQLESYIIEGGQEIYVPVEDEEAQCWHSPLPCAPSGPDIVFRGENLAAGFRPVFEIESVTDKGTP